MAIRLLLIAVLFLMPLLAVESEWSNCIGNQRCRPCLIQEPTTCGELCEIVERAVSQKISLRAVGNGYSISDIACTEGCLVSMKRLNRILSVDQERRLVRVEAGIALRELNKAIAAYGLALPNQPAIDAISLGGALSTAAHGTGPTGTLSSFVREIELIAADASVHTITPTSDPDLFAAASVSLGSLGIIYAVTLQCEPLFYLKGATFSTTLDQVLPEVQDRRRDFFQFSWNPETDGVAVQHWSRCEPTAEGAVPSYQALPWYTIDPNDKDLFSEIAVPIEQLPEVIKRVRELVASYRAQGATLVDISVRFAQHDRHSLLSPASDGPVAYLAFSLLEGEKFLHLYRELERELYSYGGRPHWGKTHFLTGQMAERLYGSQFHRFAAVKRRVDPLGLFSNEFIQRLLTLR